MFIINTFSTCFEHHYAHLQETKTCVTARGVLRCNKRRKVDICCNVFFVGCCIVNLDGTSCVNGCVVVLDWYMSHAFFRSGVSGVGVLMHALCLFGFLSHVLGVLVG